MVDWISCISLLPFAIALILIGYVSAFRLKTPVSRAFLVFLISIALLTLLEFLAKIPFAASFHSRLYRILCVPYFFMAYAYVRLIFKVCEKKEGVILAVVFWAITIAAAISVIVFSQEKYFFPSGTVTPIPRGVLLLLMSAVGLSCAFLTLQMLIQRYLNLPHSIRRTQIGLLIGGNLLSLMYTVVISALPAVMNAPASIRFSSIGMIFQIGFIFYAVYRHDFSVVNINEIRAVSRLLFENTPDAMVVFDRDGQCVEINRAASDLFGESPEPQLIARLLTGYEPLCTLVAKDVVIKLEDCLRNVVFSQHPIGVEKNHIGYILLVRDNTLQLRNEQELLRGRQIESLGLLAGGIAHDFNNYLTGIIGCITMARLSLTKDAAVVKLLDDAQQGAVKAAGLTRQLITFSAGGKPLQVSLETAQVVSDAVCFALHGSMVKLNFSYDRNVLPLWGDKHQMDQLFGNIAINARQAMDHGGELTVTVQNRVVGLSDSRGIADGTYIEIVFTDTGNGIAPDILPRVFEPYFTTKKSGSGIGLATVHSICRQHGGQVSIASEAGKGTTLTVLLPAAKNRPTPPVAQTIELTEAGSKRILIMDDDLLVQKSLALMLKSLGYVVVTSSTGEEALTLFTQAAGGADQFRLVIADLTVINGMGGRELAETIKKDHPQAVLIVSSGYSDDEVVAHYARYGFRGVLRKPYSLEELKQAIAKALRQPDTIV